MTIRLNGSTSGYTEIDAPASAGNNTLLLPTGNGSAGNIIGTDGAGNLSWVNGRMVLEAAKASTSGTSIDFTGIPNWVKRVTVMFDGVSTSGGSPIIVQLGNSGGVVNTGYACTIAFTGPTANVGTGSTAGFPVTNNAAASVMTGHVVITLFSSNGWVYSSLIARTNDGYTLMGGGSKTLSATLDRIRITTVNGTDTFDAGSINILYEG